MDSETNRTEVTVYDWISKLKLWQVWKIPTISRYKHFAFSARNPGRVSLNEFQTSATFYVTIPSNDQVMPKVESVNDLHSFAIIPAGLSNERAWYFTICTTYIRKKYDDVEDAHDVTCPKPLTQIYNEIKRYVGACDNDKENMKNTLWNICDKNINIACLYYVRLSVGRTDIICSRNVNFLLSFIPRYLYLLTIFSRSTCIVMK